MVIILAAAVPLLVLVDGIIAVSSDQEKRYGILYREMMFTS